MEKLLSCARIRLVALSRPQDGSSRRGWVVLRLSDLAKSGSGTRDSGSRGLGPADIFREFDPQPAGWHFRSSASHSPQFPQRSNGVYGRKSDVDLARSE